MVQRASRVGLAFAVAAVAATGFLASNAFATFPGANGRIAFVGDMPGCSAPPASPGAICTVEPNGSGVKQLTSFGHTPSWSANGRRIAFLTRRAIDTMKADGTDRTKIAAPRTTSAAFSPSGARIVYVEFRATPRRVNGAIYTIRTDGTRKRLVLASRGVREALGSRGVPETPTYSPDGSRIVFAGKPPHRSWGIWTIRPDGTGLRPVTTNPPSTDIHNPRTDHFPDWSPDGRQIEFVRYTDCDDRFCSGPIKFIRPDGSGIHGNREISVPSRDEGGTRSFRYAPSGDRLVSSATEAPEGIPYIPQCGDIFTVPVIGGSRTTVTHNCDNYLNGGPLAFASEPSWQPLPGG